MKKKTNQLAEAIRAAVVADGRSLYAISRAAGVAYQSAHPFIRGQREDIALSTADRLCAALGLELRPVNRKAR